MNDKKNLWSLPQGQKALITHLDKELTDEFRVRLEELGIHPGETVECVKSIPFGGPKVYQVGESIYSLDEQIGEKIQIGDYHE